MIELRFPMLLILIGMLIGIINTMFFVHLGLYVVGAGLLFVAAGLILFNKKRSNGYKTNRDFVKGELDVLILMLGVVLFGIKFFFQEPYSSILHFISLGTIFIILGFGKKLKVKTVKK